MGDIVNQRLLWPADHAMVSLLVFLVFSLFSLSRRGRTMVPSKHHGRAKGALYLLRSPGLSSEEEMEALDPLMSL